jgi:sortase (surface protein transpeptidase)
MIYFQMPVQANSVASINIPSIGVETTLNTGSHSDLVDMGKKILYKPVLDTEFSYDLCTEGRNSYVAGHSSPAKKWQNSYPAVRVFQNVHKLQINDIIDAENQDGVKCSYKVSDVKIFSSNKIKDNTYVFPRSVFNYLMDDDKDGKSTLTLQTCDKQPGVIIAVKAEKID